MTDDLPLVLKVPDVAEALQCSTDAVYDLVNDGELDSVRIGRVIRVPRHALLEFLGAPQDSAAGTGDGEVADLAAVRPQTGGRGGP